jgi:hypothetical protein
MMECNTYKSNNRLLSKPPDFVLEQGAQVRATQHIQTYVRYAILLRALRVVLLRKTGKFAPNEFVRYAILLRALRVVLLRKTGKFAPNEFVRYAILLRALRVVLLRST